MDPLIDVAYRLETAAKEVREYASDDPGIDPESTADLIEQALDDFKTLAGERQP